MYKKQRIHLVGIGGTGMSGIAEVLLNLGYPVSGSDLKRSATTTRLKKRGATIYYGHKRENIAGAQVVVVSSAIKLNNPEVAEAQGSQIPIVARAEMLAELMRFSKYGIAVAGSHGKTTTTSLIASLLYTAGFDPTMVIGGRVNNFRSNARLGRGDFMVAESDESDGSFLRLSPTIEVITSIDREHMDYYHDFEEVKKAFLTFAGKVPFYGAVICCIDHPVVRELVPLMGKRVMTYGFSEEAQFSARNLVPDGPQTTYDLFVGGEKKTTVTLTLPGRHNVLNSLAVAAVAHEIGVPLKAVSKTFAGFKGIHRRCEVLLKTPKVTVIDDYGHHPEEIKATLAAVRGAFAGRLVTLFQPHRYTRTHDLFADFLGAFDLTDVLFMTDIYPAGEAPIENVHSKILAEAIAAKRGNVTYIPKTNKITDEIVGQVQEGDVVLTLGAGDVTGMGKEIAKKLRKIF